LGCKAQVRFMSVKTALSRSGLPDLEYALNPYVGCQHGCLYCYAPNYVGDTDIKANWGRLVVVKENLGDVLLEEVLKKKRGVVGLGTITDAYQQVESVYGLARLSLKILLTHGFRVSIQTKSTLVIKDIDVLMKYKDRVDIGFTITNPNYEKTKLVEPCSPPPAERIKILRLLSETGLRTWVFIGPIIDFRDGKFEKDMEKLILQVKDYVDVIYYDHMRLKPNIYLLDDPYRLMLVKSALNKDTLLRIIENLCIEHGVKCKPAFSDIKQQKLYGESFDEVNG